MRYLTTLSYLLDLNPNVYIPTGLEKAEEVFQGWDFNKPLDELGGATLAESLLAPHRCYWEEVQTLRNAGVSVKGIVHVTTGGFDGNAPRVLSEEVALCIHRGSWTVPPLVSLIHKAGSLSNLEMGHTFNMGKVVCLFFVEGLMSEVRVRALLSN